MRWFAVLCGLLAVVWSGCGSNPPASLEFVDISPAQPKIGEITTIRFKAVDSRGDPMAGAQVTFTLQGEPPNVELNPKTATTNKGTGVVETQMIAKGRVSSVVVTAESEGKTAVSPPITFAGSSASARQFSFECGPIGGDGSGGVRAIIAWDESRSLVNGIATDCTAHVADRNGDGITGAQVSFLVEAGAIGPTQTSSTDLVGNATILYKTSYPLPHSTDPLTFSWTPPNDSTHTGDYLAPLWMHPFEWTQNPLVPVAAEKFQEPRRPDPIVPGRTNNPRDNLVSMIAVTTGEEGFDDKNNNGVYDEGETWDDLTEPFVDSNDNGTWDLDERFVDTNNDGLWNGKNGKFDASTLIWTEAHLLWTGLPHGEDVLTSAQNPKPIFRQLSPTGPQALSHLGHADFVFMLADPWFNTIARNSEDDGCGVEGSNLVVSEPERFAAGIRWTYPPVEVITYRLRDVHDPTAIPPPPAYPSPQDWAVDVACKYTASRRSAWKIKLAFPGGSGTVL